MTRALKYALGCPKKGWDWVGAVDLHDDEGLEFGDYETCEYCHKEQIRYVHTLSHPDWKYEIRVGRICSDELSGDPRAATTEKRLRNRSQRRANFPKLRSWRASAKGNLWIKYKDHHIVVMEREEAFRLSIDGELGKLYFKTEREAKLRAFDVVMYKLRKHG